jgi:hypothetical protein
MYKFYSKLPKKYLLPVKESRWDIYHDIYNPTFSINLKDIKYGDKGYFYQIFKTRCVTPFIVVYNKNRIIGVIFPYVYNDSNDGDDRIKEYTIGDDMVKFMTNTIYNYDNLLNKSANYEITYYKYECMLSKGSVRFGTFGASYLDTQYTKEKYTRDMFNKDDKILNKYVFPSLVTYTTDFVYTTDGKVIDLYKYIINNLQHNRECFFGHHNYGKDMCEYISSNEDLKKQLIKSNTEYELEWCDYYMILAIINNNCLPIYQIYL